MRRILTTFVFCLSALLFVGFSGITASAEPIIVGTTNSTQATANITSFSLTGNTFTFTIRNTSPFDARITGIGFDLAPLGNSSASGLNGFTGVVVNAPASTDFTFRDDNLGNVPSGFNNVVLDFGFTTSNNGNFTGGSPNDGLAPGQSATFSVTGPFGNFTAQQIIDSIFVRFQRVGANGQGSDVGRPVPGTPGAPVPEPATMFLLGTGMAGVAAKLRKRRRCSAIESQLQ